MFNFKSDNFFNHFPFQALNLYLDGDKSKVIDIDNPDVTLFPRFMTSHRHVIDLEPGDVLFIPALWFHNMTAKDFGIAINVFWKNLDAGKTIDIYLMVGDTVSAK